jgi:hypothetical protein
MRIVLLKTYFGKKMSEKIEQKTLFEISKKSLTTLENLINNNQIETPVKFSDLLDIAIGALIESEVVDRISLIDILVEDPELLYDIIEFEEDGKYNLHDIISQIVCFRLIVVMQEFLNHINVEYITKNKEIVFEKESTDN